MKTHGNTLDLSGRAFGRLRVVGRDWARATRVHWLCRCECGREASVASCNLVAGKSRSCGRCKGIREHVSEYRTWADMPSRCSNPRHQAWPDYGGRGIDVCQRWRDSFQAFLADMGPRPDGMWLDRKDNDGPYSPDNCRWATPTEQANNKRSNRRISIDGRTQTLAEWVRELGLNYRTVKSRLNVGHWTPEEALRA